LERYGIEAWLEKWISDNAMRKEAIYRLAEQWAEEFDANSLVILRRALEGFDTEPCFSRIKARVLYVLCRTDNLFPPSLAPEVMAKLDKAGVVSDYFEIDSRYGHLASGLDAGKWAERLRSFMDVLYEENAVT
ncbi:MAG: hypothetical protein PF495_19710, partial [Spirochaetales bacterium]|nr:hypothetical protein [Spirochaetales bacterium]